MPEQAPTEVPMPENMPPIHDAPVAKPRGRLARYFGFK
jgi:hypothetical protein